ncbi:MAG: efflux RND transporter periplasmic adaptor subunit [Thermoanaerobaculia bacterium]
MLGLGLLGLAACSQSDRHEPAQAPPAVRARTAVAARREVPERIEVPGSVEAGRKSTLAARVMATVTAVLVEDGERVTQGQTLLTLDPATSEGQVAQARGALAQAEAALTLARRNHERFAALAADDAASELEADMARTQLEQAEGAVEQARGALEAARNVAGDTRLAAPFTGRVASRMVDPGDLAAPGRPLLVVESEASRRLVVSVPESAFARAGLEAGHSVPVAIDALPDSPLVGTVVVLGAGADPSTHAIRVELELPTGEAATGSAGRAWLPVGRREAVVVPADAVLRRGGLERVVVATDGGTSTRVVTTGAALDDGVEVLSGLTGGEVVLLGLSEPPPNGSPVEPIAAEQPDSAVGGR